MNDSMQVPTKAAIIAVGSELLGTERLDTNSLRLTALLEGYGVRLVRKAVVGDNQAEIVAELDAAAARSSLILISGGLGPTRDDLTREAVAAWCGRALTEDPELARQLRDRYAAFGREMPESNLKQAQIIDGALALDNPAGTAPGLRITHRDVTLFLLPGVPRELEAMAERHLRPFLASVGDPELRLVTVEARFACTPESAVEDRLTHVYARYGRENITVLARPGEVRVLVRLEGAGLGLESMAETERTLRQLGDGVFTLGEHDLAEVVHGKLQARDETLAVAESCTGGMLGARLTSVAGSSGTFVGGAIVYANQLKEELLGVRRETLECFGAVSPEVARQMASGARERFGSTYALAITGVAGPGGGSEEKPVGTVDFALAAPDGCRWVRARFPGAREPVRYQATQFALDLLRRRLDDLPWESFWTVSADDPSSDAPAADSASPPVGAEEDARQ
jgi:nicotinamide-nucleotide amidase